MTQFDIIPTTKYTLADMAFLMGTSVEDACKEMTSHGCDMDEDGCYFGDNIINAGLGVIGEGFQMPKPREKTEYLYGFKPDKLYTVSEVAAIHGTKKTSMRTLLDAFWVPQVLQDQQFNAGFSDGFRRHLGSEIINAIETHKLDKPPNQAPELIIAPGKTLNAPQRAVAAILALPAEKMQVELKRKAGIKCPPHFTKGEALGLVCLKARTSIVSFRQTTGIKKRAPEVFEAMAQGQIPSVSKAKQISNLPKETRAEALRLVVLEQEEKKIKKEEKQLCLLMKVCYE